MLNFARRSVSNFTVPFETLVHFEISIPTRPTPKNMSESEPPSEIDVSNAQFTVATSCMLNILEFLADLNIMKLGKFRYLEACKDVKVQQDGSYHFLSCSSNYIAVIVCQIEKNPCSLN